MSRRIATLVICLAALACGGCKTLEVKSVTFNLSFNLPITLPAEGAKP